MLGTIFAKGIRDRWSGMMTAALGVSVMLLLGMAVYSGIDTSFFYDLPDGFLDGFGISTQLGGVAGIAYGAIFNLMGAFAIAGMAISIGANSIAGEERDGTIGLLLANPRSRVQVLLSKLGSMVALLALSGVVLWAAALVIPSILNVDVTGVQVGALVLHLIINALFWGMLALAIGAATGNRTAAVGGAAGVMVLSWLATSFLPLVDSVSGLAKAFPWYYFSASQPEVNGPDWGHLSVLLIGSLALGAVGIAGLVRRDLRSASSKPTLVDRLRANPRTAAIAERIAGNAQVSSITAKTFSDHQGLMAVIAMLVFYVTVLLTPFYNLLPDSIGDAFRDLPDAVLAAIGGVDMSTPIGWLQGELFSITVPLAAIILLAVIGANALAGEEENHTMGLLLANPISRSTIVLEKVKAMVAYAGILFVLTWGGTALGVILGGMEVSILNIGAISALCALLGLVFGGVALALSAATGRVRIALFGAAGLGLVGYFVQSFFPLSKAFEPFAVASPFHYYLSSQPLVNGMDWGHAGILAGLFAALVAVSIPLFNRRDLRG